MGVKQGESTLVRSCVSRVAVGGQPERVSLGLALPSLLVSGGRQRMSGLSLQWRQEQLREEGLVISNAVEEC